MHFPTSPCLSLEVKREEYQRFEVEVLLRRNDKENAGEIEIMLPVLPAGSKSMDHSAKTH